MSAHGPEHSANPPRAGSASAEALSGRRRVTIDQARASPIPEGNLAAVVLAHGSLIVEYYAPRGTDSQTAHTRDEVYIVIAGRGWFVNGPERHPFGPADVLFVPAGAVHRFEEFTDDFAVWVVFYGPEGGERAAT